VLFEGREYLPKKRKSAKESLELCGRENPNPHFSRMDRRRREEGGGKTARWREFRCNSFVCNIAELKGGGALKGGEWHFAGQEKGGRKREMAATFGGSS